MSSVFVQWSIWVLAMQWSIWALAMVCAFLNGNIYDLLWISLMAGFLCISYIEINAIWNYEASA